MAKEITRIVTVKITSVGKVYDDSKLINREEVEKYLKKYLKNSVDCDDVQVLDVQDFILDVDDEVSHGNRSRNHTERIKREEM